MPGPIQIDVKELATKSLVAPHALNFAQLYRLTGNLYSYRWDEAMRDNPQNALSMKREAFYLSLLQERFAPTINLEWQIEVDDDNDPKQLVVRDGLARLWRETPDRVNLLSWLLQAVWYGRSGQQGIWGRQETKLWGWVYHEPVNGDGIQYQWDGTPVVLVHQQVANYYQQRDKEAVIWSSDRGAYGLRLYKPEYRRRFIINTHNREAADYFEGEMAGGVHGVGLRSWLYWSGWMRTEVLSWMFSFMQSTGMMDLLVFNFPQGNSAAEAQAIANAKKVTGKLAMVMPRMPGTNFEAVDQIQMNTQGVEVLKSLIEDFYDKHAERLIVGQSMSSGADTDGSLGGTGKAEFAKDTKYQLCKTDAIRLGEALTRDYIKPAKEFNWPWAEFPARLVPVLNDPDNAQKVEAGVKLLANGVTLAEDEFRKAGGYRKPRPGEKTLGGEMLGAAGIGSPMPGGLPGDPNGMGPPPPETGDPFKDIFDGADEPIPDGYAFSYLYDESKHRRGQPGNAGQFGSGGGVQGAAAAGRATKPKVTDGADAHPHDERREGAKGHVRGLLARVKEVPGELRDKVTTFVKAKYEKLAERYGPHGAKAVLAGAVLLTPIPLPGTTLIPVALAEAVMRIRKMAVGRATKIEDKGVAQYEGEEAQPFDFCAAVREFVEEFYKAMGEDCPDLDESALKHVEETLGHA